MSKQTIATHVKDSFTNLVRRGRAVGHRPRSGYRNLARAAMSAGVYFTVLVLPLLVGLTACLASGDYRKSHPLVGTTVDASLGVNVHFIEPPAGELERIRNVGFRWIRTDITWSEIERAPGVFDFSRYDRLMNGLRRNRLRAILVLDYGNPLYERDAPSTPDARSAFARFAVAAVTRYRHRGIVWEMWNEPNGAFWKPRANVDAYVALALEVGRAIRAAAPDEWLVGPALNGVGIGFLSRCFESGLLQYWDAVTVHPYRFTPPETAAPDFTAIRRLIERYAPAGKTIPLLTGEWGYTTLIPGVNLQRQAAYLVRIDLVGLMCGVPVSIWYDWRDDGVDPVNFEHHFGVILPNGAPKPAVAAARTLTSVLAGFGDARRIDLGASDDYCLLFKRGRTQALALWTSAAPHRVTIPTTPGGFRVVRSSSETTDVTSRASGLEVEIGEAPVFVIPRSGRFARSFTAEHDRRSTIGRRVPR